MGAITKGIKALPKLPIEERIYLFCNGLQFEGATGGIPAPVDNYSLYNNRPLRAAGVADDGDFQQIWIYKYSTGGTCTLAGTDKKVNLAQKRFLAFDAIAISGADSNDFRVIVSKTKDLGDDQNTAYYSFTLSETRKTYYIDLKELNFTEGYICFAGGALTNWSGTAGFYITRVYLTNQKYSAIKVLYNRGDDQSTANPPIGWEGFTNGSYDAATLETDHIEFRSSASKGTGAKTTRAFELYGNEICFIADVTAVGTQTYQGNVEFQTPEGVTIGNVRGFTVTVGTDKTVKLLRTNVLGNTKEVINAKMILTAAAGVSMDVKAIWLQ